MDAGDQRSLDVHWLRVRRYRRGGVRDGESMRKMRSARRDPNPFFDGVQGMCSESTGKMIRFLPGDRARAERIADDLRNQFLDHDGQAVTCYNGLILAVGVSHKTYLAMQQHVDSVEAPPGGCTLTSARDQIH
jgi:hypothetical protein